MQHLPTNTLLKGGEYRVTQVLGQGGFGITYLATQPASRRKVAIKEFFMKEYCNRDENSSHISAGSIASSEIVKRYQAKFLKEIRNIQKLSHPNIIRIYDVFEENGTAYYVMPYLDSGSLEDKVKNQGALPEAEALRYFTQIADAVTYVHEKKINHLDIKPGNIMLNKQGKAVLIDFGLSKQYDFETGGQTSTTPTGYSEGYTPVEQRLGKVSTFSPQTDIYALGATLYFLVTGQNPPGTMEVFDHGLPPMPASISSSIVKAIEQAMQSKKDERPSSVKELLRILTYKATPKVNPQSVPSQSTNKPKPKVNSEETVYVKETPKTQPRPKTNKQSYSPPPQTSNSDNNNGCIFGVIVVIVIAAIAFFVTKNGFNDTSSPDNSPTTTTTTNTRPTTYEESTTAPQSTPSRGTITYSGNIGNMSVNMTLNHQSGSGTYYYTNVGQDLYLTITSESASSMVLEEHNADGMHTGTFNGKISSSGVYSGTFTAYTGKSYRFKLYPQ